MPSLLHVENCCVQGSSNPATTQFNSSHRPKSRAETPSNKAYKMKTIPETTKEHEPIDFDADTDKVPSTIDDSYEVTLPDLPASSGTGAEDEMMYETVTAENN